MIYGLLLIAGFLCGLWYVRRKKVLPAIPVVPAELPSLAVVEEDHKIHQRGGEIARRRGGA